MSIVVGLTCLIFGQTAISPIDLRLAAKYFEEVATISRQDDGKRLRGACFLSEART